MILPILETPGGSQTRSSLRKKELLEWTFERVRSKFQDVANSKDLARLQKHDFANSGDTRRLPNKEFLQKEELLEWTFERVRSKVQFLLILKT